MAGPEVLQGFLHEALIVTAEQSCSDCNGVCRVVAPPVASSPVHRRTTLVLLTHEAPLSGRGSDQIACRVPRLPCCPRHAGVLRGASWVIRTVVAHPLSCVLGPGPSRPPAAQGRSGRPGLQRLAVGPCAGVPRRSAGSWPSENDAVRVQKQPQDQPGACGSYNNGATK